MLVIANAAQAVKAILFFKIALLFAETRGFASALPCFLKMSISPNSAKKYQIF
jgi:hypothetical protein